MSDWYAAVGRFLGGFPDRMVAFDFETTGLDVADPRTLITQCGYALAVDGRCVAHGSVVLDWSRPGPARMPADAYRGAIDGVARAMAARGATYRVSWDTIRDRGVEPAGALAEFRGLLAAAQAAGWSLAGHNAHRYDAPLLCHWCRRLGFPFDLDGERLVDSGLLEKSRRMGHTPPLPGECSRFDWYDRIAAVRSPVKWKLDGACDEEYGLVARLGGGAGMAHDAEYDCRMTHALVEAMRERARAAAAAA